MKIEVKGAEDIIKKMEALSKTEAKKVVRKALREAMKPMLAAVKDGLPVVTGEQKASVKLRAMKRSRKSIGVKIELADPTGKLGTIPTEYGWHAGKDRHEIEGQGNVRKAFEGTKSQTIAGASEQIKDGIEAEWGKK